MREEVIVIPTFEVKNEECPFCLGTGIDPLDKRECIECDGSGKINNKISYRL